MTEELLTRVEALLPPGAPVRRQQMFGATSVLLNGALACAVGPDGTLLVRVDPERHADLIALPGVTQATMGRRDMGPSWLRVAAEALDGDQLAAWIDEVVAYNPRCVTLTQSPRPKRR